MDLSFQAFRNHRRKTLTMNKIGQIIGLWLIKHLQKKKKILSASEKVICLFYHLRFPSIWSLSTCAVFFCGCTKSLLNGCCIREWELYVFFFFITVALHDLVKTSYQTSEIHLHRHQVTLFYNRLTFILKIRALCHLAPANILKTRVIRCALLLFFFLLCFYGSNASV